jgi:SAM-dependent methyltransferase
MIGIAQVEAKKAGCDIDFRVMDATVMEPLKSETFDIVISSVALCFNIEKFFMQAARVLKHDGVLCFSDVHPIQGGGQKQGKGIDAQLIVDNYFGDGVQKLLNVFGKLHKEDEDYEWQWEHYTLENYFSAINKAGLLVQSLFEPLPNPSAEDINPGLYAFASKCPVFVLIKATKP